MNGPATIFHWTASAMSTDERLKDYEGYVAVEDFNIVAKALKFLSEFPDGGGYSLASRKEIAEAMRLIGENANARRSFSGTTRHGDNRQDSERGLGNKLIPMADATKLVMRSIKEATK